MMMKRCARHALALTVAGCALAATQAVAAAPEDQVVASFQRMLSHEASRVAPPAPRSAGEDPLRTAVNAVIWKTQPPTVHIAAATAMAKPAAKDAKK